MTDSDISPADAVRIARGEVDSSTVGLGADDGAAVDDGAASTAESQSTSQASMPGAGESDRFGRLVDGLRSTDPHPDLNDVGSLLEGMDNPDRLLARGVAKIGGVDSREAWVDILRALIGFSRQMGSGGSTAESQDTSDGADSAEDWSGLDP